METTEYAAGLSTEVSKVTSGETITYLKSGGGIMGFERSSDGAMFWFITDALGTVRDVVDSAGVVKASYEFDPDGRKISPPNTEGVESPKTWIGGLSVNDDTADAGLYLMGHRFYDPSISRFLNRDPIGFAGGLNLYEYAANSPVDAVDPEGLEPSFYHAKTGIPTPRTPITRGEVEFYLNAGFTVVTIVEAGPMVVWQGGNMLFRAGAKQTGAKMMAAGASGSPTASILAAGGAAASRGAGPDPCQNPVDEAAIRRALQGSNLRTMQPSVSLPRIQRNVARLRAGETPDEIIVYDNIIIVDGNHRYISGRIYGVEPPIRPGTLSSTQTQYSKPITDIIVDLTDF